MYHTSFSSYPFEPVISVAESPQGALYFGAFHVYNLTLLDLTKRVQDFFPVHIEKPEYLTVKGLTDQNFVLLDVNSTAAATGEEGEKGELNITVPESLLTNVSAVNITQSGVEQSKEFLVDEDNDNNTISIQVSPELEGRIVIHGSGDSEMDRELAEEVLD
jgi:hypothetical protein